MNTMRRFWSMGIVAALFWASFLTTSGVCAPSKSSAPKFYGDVICDGTYYEGAAAKDMFRYQRTDGFGRYCLTVSEPSVLEVHLVTHNGGYKLLLFNADEQKLANIYAHSDHPADASVVVAPGNYTVRIDAETLGMGEQSDYRFKFVSTPIPTVVTGDVSRKASALTIYEQDRILNYFATYEKKYATHYYKFVLSQDMSVRLLAEQDGTNFSSGKLKIVDEDDRSYFSGYVGKIDETVSLPAGVYYVAVQKSTQGYPYKFRLQKA